MPPEQLLLTRELVSEHTLGYWRFELGSGVYKDSAGKSGDIAPERMEVASSAGPSPELIDFCHVLLNSNEFLYVD